MKSVERHGSNIIALSFLLAFMLTAMPLPEWATVWRPAWVALVLIYWVMALPNRVGIGVAWLLGLMIDVLQGTMLGLNAMGYALLAFIIIKSYLRIRVYSLIQQSIIIGFIISFYLLLVLWVRSLTETPDINGLYWMPVLTSMFLWPWLFIVLRDVRRKFNVY